MAKLGDLADIGPDRRDIYDGFTTTDSQSPYPAFWGHDSDEVTSLSLKPNKWLSPRVAAAAGRPKRDIALLWPKAARLLIGERLWLVTQRLTSIRLTENSLSNVWWPILLKKPSASAEKALALWLNSTIGLLLFLYNRVPTRGPWVQFKKPTLRSTAVLDVTALTDKQLKEISDAYDLIDANVFEPISSLGSDSSRADADALFQKTLGLPDIAPIRTLLGQEPTITNISLAEEESAETFPVIDQEQLSFGI